MTEKCTSCLLPDNYPGIEFDSQGVCNYCHTHKDQVLFGEEKLHRIADEYRGKGEYDCLVGVSGGRDSAYAAYYVKNVLKLNTLAFTFDNGYMPKQTRVNIENTVKTLGLDHIETAGTWMQKSMRPILSAWLHKPSPAMVAFFCTGCATGYTRALQQAARERGIKLVITGGGEPEKSFAELLLGASEGDPPARRRSAMLKGYLRELMHNPRYLRPVCTFAFIREYYYRFAQRKIPYRFVPLFIYIPWNEDEIMSVIQRELNWKTPDHIKSSWRSDCKIHLLKQFAYLQTLGFSKNNELLSGMLRSNHIDVEAARERLLRENDIPLADLEPFLTELGFSREYVESKL